MKSVSHTPKLLDFYANFTLFLAWEDHKGTTARCLACMSSVPLSSLRPHTHAHHRSHINQLKYSGLRNQCDRLVEDPTVEPGVEMQWQTASYFSTSVWTSPGKTR